ncbi:MAG: restriction endonuclease subunit S [Burkholderiales bacterium PBB2]|nr:MAG: restriction endonuclease subunit S [Burkholderiales bacterium PBB2]
MSSDWELTRLRDHIRVKHGFAFKGEHFADEPTEYQLTTPGNFAIGGGFQDGKAKYYNGPIPAEFVLNPGDLLVTMTDLSKAADTLGYSAVVPKKNGITWLHNQRVGRVQLLPGKSTSLTFLHYLLRSPDYRHHVLAGATGSTVKHTSPDRILDFQFLLPPPSEAHRIGNLLDALDDRITLLRETNATLEAIAQALFKSWFVDFDPVRAKRDGRAPKGMDEATAALFPNSFEDSELGEVPRGWSPRPFSETVHVIGGGTPKTTVPEYWNGNIPWFSVVDAPAASDVFVIDTEKHISEAGLLGSSTKLLPAGTTILSARGTVGRLALTSLEMAMNQSCYGLKGVAGDKYFTFLSTARLVDQLKRRAHGSVFDTITRDTLAGVNLVFPADRDVIRVFEAAIEPLMLRILENLQQSRSLASLRDTLLPRLISGQLRLPEAKSEAAALQATRAQSGQEPTFNFAPHDSGQ